MNDNKLIAEFMELSIKEGVSYYTDQNDMFFLGEVVSEPYLPFDDDWKWLMAVVQKIGDDYYNTPLDETLSKLTELYENIWTLQDLHGAVVEFIKQLNEES